MPNHIDRDSLPKRLSSPRCPRKVGLRAVSRNYLMIAKSGAGCSGKTSLIHSLAGELGLDIYVVSLSSKG